MFKLLNSKLSYARVIAFMFLVLILLGAFLLMLPISASDGQSTNFIDCLFTSTSATCVTGLVIFNTGLHWSLFGKVVILLLIQIGGLGLMTIITMAFIFFKKQITLREKLLFIKSTGESSILDVKQLIKSIFLGTFLFEFIGAALLSIRFCRDFGIKAGIFSSIFHAISAFCNAGFDIMGDKSSSLISYDNDYLVNITIMALIIIGGLGFLVWNDVSRSRFNVRKFKLHTKIVIFTTLGLIITGAALMYIFEYYYSFANLAKGPKVLAAFFQAISPRTAGFNTVNQANLSESGSLLTMVLMFIGGSPGSTAGGIKTTTFFILLINTIFCAKNQQNINICKKRISNVIINQAVAITFIYLLAVILSTIIICAIEPFPLKKIIFEVISAIGTVGLSMGITPYLCSASKIILIMLMYAGRLGGLTLALVIAEKREKKLLIRPTERILVG